MKIEESKDKENEEKVAPVVYKARNVRPKIQEKHLKVFGCKDHGEDVYCHGKKGEGNMRFYIFSSKMGAKYSNGMKHITYIQTGITSPTSQLKT